MGRPAFQANITRGHSQSDDTGVVQGKAPQQEPLPPSPPRAAILCEFYSVPYVLPQFVQDSESWWGHANDQAQIMLPLPQLQRRSKRNFRYLWLRFCRVGPCLPLKLTQRKRFQMLRKQKAKLNQTKPEMSTTPFIFKLFTHSVNMYQ